MEKNEFKNCINAISPDVHLKTRLKAKVLSAAEKPHKGQKKLFVPAVSAVLCVAVFALCITNLPAKDALTTSPGKAESTAGTSTATGWGGVMLAYAADGEGETQYLELGVTVPLSYKMKVTDLRGLSEKERDAVIEKESREYKAEIDALLYYGGYDVMENVLICRTVSNQYTLDIDDPASVENIHLTCTEYGLLGYPDFRNSVETANAFLTGTDLTIPGDVYAQIMELEAAGESHFGIDWRTSGEMDEAIDADPDKPLSSYSDTLTFTVNFKDGTVAQSVVELTFDDDGNLTATCVESGLHQ